jgi:DNA repair protein RadA/Sms
MSYRIIRAVKNRFGSTNEIGMFEMIEQGLIEVSNPSGLLLSGRPTGVSGTCVACTMEGTRPVLAEVQGLVTQSGFGNPRRVTIGFDFNRLAMLIAVLEKRMGYIFGNMDAYVNIVGGLRLNEPAADLSVALSLVSSLKDVVVADNVLAFGEVGLAGEIRAVTNCAERIAEAARMGFKKCIIPYNNLKGLKHNLFDTISIVPAKDVRRAFEAVT